MVERKEEPSGVALVVKCEECGEMFNISSKEFSSNVTHKKEFKIRERTVFLTYYTCPKCGRRHYVQIDDSVTLRMMATNHRMFVKLSKMRLQDKDIQQKQSDKYKKRARALRKRRFSLMREFEGVVMTDENGHEYNLRFSV